MSKANMAQPSKGGLKDSMASKDNSEPDKYEIEDGVRTLERAEEIKNDKRLMPHVHKHIGKKLKSLKDLRSLAGKKKNEEDAEEAGEV